MKRDGAARLHGEIDDPTGPMTAFRFIDLFAGIGGIRLGLESAGGRCVYTVENDRFAIRTYSARFGDDDGVGLQVRDIRRLHAADIPPYDVLAAGFPCQPFSIAGVSKKTSLGREHGFGDSISGNLIFHLIQVIKETSPKVLFLENVKHLLRHDGGKTFAVIENSLRDLGYTLAVRVIDARWWVPQHRERIYIIGLHKGQLPSQQFVYPDPPLDAHVPTPFEILDKDPDPKYTLSAHLWEYLQAYARKHEERGNGFGYGLVDASSTVTRTLSARYHKDGSEILVQQEGTRPRRLTPNECRKLMGFPEGFPMPVSDTQAYRQLGNSVVVPVIEFLAQALASQLWPGFGKAQSALDPKAGPLTNGGREV